MTNFDYINERGELNNDVFVGKLGTSQDYSWLWDEADDFANTPDEQIRDFVKMHAGIIYDRYCYECDELSSLRGIDINVLTVDQFLAESDYEDAIKATIAARNAARAESELGAIMTIVEVADEYDVKEDTVRKACQRFVAGESGGILCRQSGSAYLLRRSDVAKRWGTEMDEEAPQPIAANMTTAYWYNADAMSGLRRDLGVTFSGDKSMAVQAEIILGDQQNPLILLVDGRLYWGQVSDNNNIPNRGRTGRYTPLPKYSPYENMVRLWIWRHNMKKFALSDTALYWLNVWLKRASRDGVIA